MKIETRPQTSHLEPTSAPNLAPPPLVADTWEGSTRAPQVTQGLPPAPKGHTADAATNRQPTFDTSAAPNIGNKAANLACLRRIAQQADVGAHVPEFLAIPHEVVQAHVQQALTASGWQDFAEAHLGKADSLSEATRQAIEAARAAIREAFATPLPEVMAWVQAQGETSFMVRSSGREDSHQVVNAGGNVSVSHVPGHADAIAAAMGEVVASYFSEKSIGQRLLAGDDISAPPFMPVLLQVMVGEPKDSPKPYASGVMFSREATGNTPGVVHVQAAWGHNEAVVTGQVPVDNYFCRDNTQHAVITHKPQRLYPGDDAQLDWVNNPASLQSAPCLPAHVITRLATLARRLEPVYHGPVDVEFTYDPNTDRIALLQVRPLQTPSTASPTHLTADVLQNAPKQAGTVIGSAGGTVRRVHTRAQMICHETLEGALTECLSRRDVHQVQAVLIGTSAPATSHEATTFRGLGIPVIHCPSWRDAMPWLQGEHANLLIDTQSGDVVDGRGVDIHTGIQPGWRQHPLPDQVSLGANALSLSATNLTALLQTLLHTGWPHVATPTSPQALLSTLQKQVGPTTDKRLTDILNTLETNPDLQQAAQAAAQLLTMSIAAAHQAWVREPSLRDSTREVLTQICADIAAVLHSRSHQDADIGQRYAMHWLRSVVRQQPQRDVTNSESLVSLMQRSRELAAVRARLPHILVGAQGKLLPYWIEYARLGNTAMQPRVQQAWQEFTQTLMLSGHAGANQRLAHMMTHLQRHDVAPLWLHTAFFSTWKKTANAASSATHAATCLQSLLEDFDARDAQSTLAWATDSAQIIALGHQYMAQWSEPDNFAERWQQFRDSITHALGAIPQMLMQARLPQLIALQTCHQWVELLDKSIKTLTGSTRYGDNTAQQARNLARMLDLYRRLAQTLAQRLVEPIEEYGACASRLRKTNEIYAQLAKFPTGAQLLPSERFNVASATVIGTGEYERFAPKTLEDIFTLCHQNALAALASGMVLAGVSKHMVPPALVPLANSIMTTALPSKHGVHREEHPELVGMRYSYPHLTLQFNLPLRRHSVGVQLQAEQGPDGTLKNIHAQIDMFTRSTVIENIAEAPMLICAMFAATTGKSLHCSLVPGKSASMRWDIDLAKWPTVTQDLPRILQVAGGMLFGDGYAYRQDAPSYVFDPDHDENYSLHAFAAWLHEASPLAPSMPPYDKLTPAITVDYAKLFARHLPQWALDSPFPYRAVALRAAYEVYGHALSPEGRAKAVLTDSITRQTLEEELYADHHEMLSFLESQRSLSRVNTKYNRR